MTISELLRAIFIELWERGVHHIPLSNEGFSSFERLAKHVTQLRENPEFSWLPHLGTRNIGGRSPDIDYACSKLTSDHPDRFVREEKGISLYLSCQFVTSYHEEFPISSSPLIKELADHFLGKPYPQRRFS